MAVLARQVNQSVPFTSVDYVTVRADAKPEQRDAAPTARTRGEKRTAEGHRVLLVPHLMSFGGIELGHPETAGRPERTTFSMTDEEFPAFRRLIDRAADEWRVTAATGSQKVGLPHQGGRRRIARPT